MTDQVLWDYNAPWCICEPDWQKRGRLDPRCRHDDILDVIQRVEEEMQEKQDELLALVRMYAEMGHYSARRYMRERGGDHEPQTLEQEQGG